MIVNDQKAALIATSFLALGLLLVPATAALASDPVSSSTSNATTAVDATAAPIVTIVEDGSEWTFPTRGRSVADVLSERDIHLASDDAMSPASETSVVDGLRITIHTARPVQLRVGNTTRAIRTTAQTVGELLSDEGVRLAKFDEISPAKSTSIVANQSIFVVRIDEWTQRQRQDVAPPTERRTDSSLLDGTTMTIASGVSGIRETTIRYTSRNGGAPVMTILGTRVVRAAQPKIVVRGLASSLARVAALGFASAVHMAGSALHMIATAYTAGCYRCSGITASGVRAGFGIIAVDPSVIPLGTKVFIPGYGRAVAGDTGGAILGHRVDLGFNSESAAIQFGRRPVTLYILR